MEADISIGRKTGHFYFALTENRTENRAKLSGRDTRSGLCLAFSARLEAVHD
jgi:hypothetical protein